MIMMQANKIRRMKCINCAVDACICQDPPNPAAGWKRVLQIGAAIRRAFMQVVFARLRYAPVTF